MSDQRITIDMDRAMALMREVVEDVGADHVYRFPDGTPAGTDLGAVCQYQMNGSPACIVGHALARAGVPIDELALMDDCEDGTAITTVHSDVVEFTPDAREVFTAAQNEQDRGKTWGEALAAAELDAKVLVR